MIKKLKIQIHLLALIIATSLISCGITTVGNPGTGSESPTSKPKSIKKERAEFSKKIAKKKKPQGFILYSFGFEDIDPRMDGILNSLIEEEDNCLADLRKNLWDLEDEMYSLSENEIEEWSFLKTKIDEKLQQMDNAESNCLNGNLTGYYETLATKCFPLEQTELDTIAYYEEQIDIKNEDLNWLEQESASTEDIDSKFDEILDLEIELFDELYPKLETLVNSTSCQDTIDSSDFAQFQ